MMVWQTNKMTSFDASREHLYPFHYTLKRNLRGDDVRALRLMDNAADAAEGKSELDLGLMAFLRLSYSSFKDWSYDAPPMSGNSRAVSM
jgi:hypothetical protein